MFTCVCSLPLVISEPNVDIHESWHERQARVGSYILFHSKLFTGKTIVNIMLLTVLYWKIRELEVEIIQIMKINTPISKENL